MGEPMFEESDLQVLQYEPHLEPYEFPCRTVQTASGLTAGQIAAGEHRVR